MNWLSFFEKIFKIFPVLEKWIELKVAELPMKEVEHKEKTPLRVERTKKKLIGVRFRKDKKKKRTDRKRKRKGIDVPILEEENKDK